MNEFAFIDKATHEPCPRRDNPGGGVILCTITDPAHRHVAAHMAPSSVPATESGQA